MIEMRIGVTDLPAVKFYDMNRQENTANTT